MLLQLLPWPRLALAAAASASVALAVVCARWLRRKARAEAEGRQALARLRELMAENPPCKTTCMPQPGKGSRGLIASA